MCCYQSQTNLRGDHPIAHCRAQTGKANVTIHVHSNVLININKNAFTLCSDVSTVSLISLYIGSGDIHAEGEFEVYKITSGEFSGCYVSICDHSVLICGVVYFMNFSMSHVHTLYQ